MSNLGRFAGQLFIDGTFGDASGRFQGQIFPDGAIGDASGDFIGQVFGDGTIGDAFGRFVGQIFEDGSIGDASGQLIGRFFPDDGTFGGVGLGDICTTYVESPSFAGVRQVRPHATTGWKSPGAFFWIVLALGLS